MGLAPPTRPAYSASMHDALYMAIGAALAVTCMAGLIGFFAVRLRRHLQTNLKDAIGQQLGLSRRMTDIIIQLQSGQGKQEEQLQKLAEFTLHLKKEMATLATVVAEQQEAELAAPRDDRPKYLN